MNNSSSFEKSSDTVTQPLKAVNPSEQPAHPGGKRHLVKAAGVVGLMTLTSRILGMIRDIVTAGRFGTSWQWDAFLYAFMLPNFLRRLVGEGALSSAFIPVYSETLQQQGKDAAFRFANVVGTFLSAGLVVFLLGVELILNLLMKVELSERLNLTVDLLRIFFPYLFFISLFALAMGILNCHRHFFTPSLGPVILDLAWIAGVLWLVPMAGQMPQDQLRVLAWVLLVSGILQFAVDIPPLLKMGFRFQWIWDSAHAGLRKTGRLLLPAILGFAVVQINLMIDMICGYFIGPGANSSLWYGTRLMQFPLGVFGIAMGTALLPLLSSQIARKEIENAKNTLSFALRAVAFILLPCMVGLIALRVPIVQMLFERGEFDTVSTARTASVLMFYSFGLFFYSGEKLVAAGFFASHDTKTPVKMGILALAIDTTLNLILMQFLKESGLALATAIASAIEFSVILYFYQKKISKLPFKQMGVSFLKILAASLAMGAVCMITLDGFTAYFPGMETMTQIIRVFGTISISVLAYLGFCFLFRVHEFREALDFIRKRKKVAA